MSGKAQGQGAGIVFLCDSRGEVLEVMYDGLGIARSITPGRSWVQVVDEASAQKAHNFLTTLKSRGVAFDWEMNAPIAGEVSTLSFAGILQGEQLLIVAAKTNHGATQLFEEFARMGNQQANALRAALKENAELARAQSERDSAFYDEVSRLNNELINLQRELAKKNAELEKLNELKNQFLGMAAHDLRGSLAIITSFSGLILDEAPQALSDEQREYLSIILSSSEFMRELVDDFLDVSLIESGHLGLEPEPVDLIALVARNLDLNRRLADKKDIRLVFHHAEPALEMFLDPAKIEQVLNNLISNAIKYSPPGRSVEIRVATRLDQAAPAPEVPDDSAACAIIAVQDQGQGIPSNEMDNLFQMFGRTSVRSTGGEKSSGLGLAIARKIVEGHHGRLWVESQAGQGTTFYVSLPLHDDEQHTGEQDE